MNLKTTLSNTLNKFKTDKKSRIMVVSIIVIILVIFIFVSISINNHRIQIQNEQAKQVEIERQIQEEQIRLEKVKEEYSDLCKKYNDAVDTYNQSITNVNSFIDKISKYNLVQVSESFTEKDYINEDFNLFHEKGDDFSSIEQEIETIKAETDAIDNEYYSVCKIAYKAAINNYNVLAKEYNYLTCHSSIEYISDMPQKASIKKSTTFDINNRDFSEEELLNVIAGISDETNQLIPYYLVISQITAPSEKWVIQRIKNIPSIKSIMAVTPDNDPNGLLGKDGGYISCIYFSIDSIDQNSVKGSTIIEKGTDAGGAIEIYSTIEAALNRCDYLSQFDNTLLYSGSYTVVGTMVVRTSYQLSNQNQVTLTDQIVQVLTEIQNQE